MPNAKMAVGEEKPMPSNTEPCGAEIIHLSDKPANERKTARFYR
jgi:hypothetical protein